MTDTIHIDCIGDSITSGIKSPSYPRILTQLFHKNGIDRVQVHNRGKEGFTVHQYIQFLQSEPTVSRFQSRKPDVCILMLGTNDTRNTVNTSLVEFQQKYRQLIGILKEYTDHIFLMNIPLYSAPVQLHRQGEIHTFDAAGRIGNEFNPALEGLVYEWDVHFIDIYQPLKLKGEQVLEDGIHMNPTGNKIIAETCYEAVLPTVTHLLNHSSGE